MRWPDRPFGPTFRAENSNTSRHLAEFWMIEPEIASADLSDNAALAEALLKYTFAALLNERQQDLAFFDERIEKGLVAKLEEIVGSEFLHMDYGEAIQMLECANESSSSRSSGASTCCGIDNHVIAIVALYAHGSERVRNHRKEVSMPDLDLIKQAEQGCGTGADGLPRAAPAILPGRPRG